MIDKREYKVTQNVGKKNREGKYVTNRSRLKLPDPEKKGRTKRTWYKEANKKSKKKKEVKESSFGEAEKEQ